MSARVKAQTSSLKTTSRSRSMWPRLLLAVGSVASRPACRAVTANSDTEACLWDIWRGQSVDPSQGSCSRRSGIVGFAGSRPEAVGTTAGRGIGEDAERPMRGGLPDRIA